MRTHDEIRHWLETRPWAMRFAINAIREQKTKKDYEPLLNGQYGRDTVDAAFPFRSSPEGRRFWESVSDEFGRWYDGQRSDEEIWTWLTSQEWLGEFISDMQMYGAKRKMSRLQIEDDVRATLLGRKGIDTISESVPTSGRWAETDRQFRRWYGRD